MNLDGAEQTDFPSTESLENDKAGAYWTADCSFEPINHHFCHAPVAFQDEDEELDLDLEGRKHIHLGQGYDGDGIYNIGLHKDSVYTRLPNASQNVADAELRAYIKRHIPKHLFLDDYGELLSIEALEPERLAQLQVKLWRELPRAQAAITARPENVDEKDAILADMVAEIGNKLAESPHVFVLCERKKLECSNSFCHSVHKGLGASDNGPQTIALEPLLDIATLVPAFHTNLFNSRIFLFRREDKRYADMGFNIKSLIPKDKMNFCIQCLQFLWDQRVRAWLIMNELSQPGKLESDTQVQRLPTPEPDTWSDDGAVEYSGIKLSREVECPLASAAAGERRAGGGGGDQVEE